MLPETGYEGAIVAAEKIRAVMSATPFMTRAGDVAVTSSFGVAATEAQGPDMSLKGEALMRTADECLYSSKQAGRNRTTGVEIPAAVALQARDAC